MAEDLRRNAATMALADFEKFLRACVLLKAEMVPGTDFSRYDQWVAIHGCVMGVRAPGSGAFVNLGHQNIAFMPWHREYLRRFELDLQRVVPGATIPYWPWQLSPIEPSTLFSDSRIHRIFFSSQVASDVGGLFAAGGPANPPSWWPVGFEWRVHPALRVNGAPRLNRGSPTDTWGPSAAQLTQTENIASAPTGVNIYWLFWRQLEAGALHHNTGHNIVGGYMANPVFSPNDPLFWLHHAQVDRIWSRWQAKRVASGAALGSLYPPPTERSPFNGQIPPNGHRRDDLIWPWIGATPGFSVNAPAAVRAMLPSFAGLPARRISDVFDHSAMGAGLGGYRYA